MKESTLRIGLAAAVVGLALSGLARADVTIDQKDTDPVIIDGGVTAYTADGPLGAGGEYVAQSFTPTASSMNFAEIFLRDDTHGTVYLQLFAGNGVNPSSPGPVLGTSNSVTITLDPHSNLLPSPGGTVDFSFSTPIALTAGNKYTLVVESTAGTDIINVGNTTLRNYGRGTGSNNANSNITDFYFQEGLSTDSVAAPEPSSFLLAIAGGLGFFAGHLWRNRRKRLAA